MNELKELKAKIQEVCPELMELKQGCLLRLKKPYQRSLGLGTRFFHMFIINRIMKEVGGGVEHWLYQVVSYDNEYGSEVAPSCFVENLEEPGLRKKFTILGHPVRLEHVLRTIEKLHGNFFIDEIGCFIQPIRKKFTYNYIIENNKNIKWDLTKDLDHQSPETLQFLHKLLV